MKAFFTGFFIRIIFVLVMIPGTVFTHNPDNAYIIKPKMTDNVLANPGM